MFVALRNKRADLAQLVEQRIRNAWVGGSNPLIGTIFLMDLIVFPKSLLFLQLIIAKKKINL